MKIKIDASERRRICPFKIEKSLKNGWNADRNDIITEKESLTIKATFVQQYNKLMAIKSIFNVQCQVADHHWFSTSKGIIYVQDYDITEKDLNEGLMKRYGNMEEVTQAQWIYPRNSFN